MRHPLVLAVLAVAADDLHHDVVGLRGAVGTLGRGRVRHEQEHVAQLARRGIGFGVEPLLVVTQRAALRRQPFGGGLVTAATRLADLLRQRLDAGPDVVALPRPLPLQNVESCGAVEVRRVDAASRNSGPEGVEVGTQAPGVEHCAFLSRRGPNPASSPKRGPPTPFGAVDGR